MNLQVKSFNIPLRKRNPEYAIERLHKYDDQDKIRNKKDIRLKSQVY